MARGGWDILLQLMEFVKRDSDKFGVDYIASILMWAKVQFHVSHIQTSSFAQHEAMGKFYEGITDLGDDIIECLLGRLGGRLGRTVLPPVEAQMQPLFGIDKMTIFADQLFAYGNGLNYQDIANLAAELQQLINKTRYRLSLS